MTSKAIPEQSEDRQQKSARSRLRALGKALSLLYGSVTTEPVPDEFMRLLSEIDARQTTSPKK
jgi:Anti-sigma factor NepR